MHGLLEVSGTQLVVVTPENVTLQPKREQHQVKLWVKNNQSPAQYAAILTQHEGDVWLAYPPNERPKFNVSIDGSSLPLDDARIVPPGAYALVEHGEIRFVSKGVVAQILSGEEFPRTMMEDLAEENDDIHFAVEALQGFIDIDSLSPLQEVLYERLQQMGWQN